MRPRRDRRAALAAVAAGWLASVPVLVGCGSDDSAAVAPVPVVADIDPAIEAVEAERGGDVSFLEISADLERVRLFVAELDDAGRTAAAIPYAYDDGRLTAIEPAEATGPVFPARAVGFDPATIFDGIRDELDDPVILDFAVVATDSGEVTYDATVASDNGGLLVVDLAPDGEVLGVEFR